MSHALNKDRNAYYYSCASPYGVLSSQATVHYHLSIVALARVSLTYRMKTYNKIAPIIDKFDIFIPGYCVWARPESIYCYSVQSSSLTLQVSSCLRQPGDKALFRLAVYCTEATPKDLSVPAGSSAGSL